MPNLADQAAAYVEEARAIMDAAEAEGRLPDARERAEMGRLLAKSDQLIHRAQTPVAALDDFHRPEPPVDWGTRFVQSKGYKAIRDPGSRPQQFSTGMIEISSPVLDAKGSLLESAAGGGAGLVSVPQVVPGTVDKLFQPLRIERLILAGRTTAPTVRYVIEGTALSGTAGVAEAGVKPQSTFGFTTTDETVRKVATSVVMSDEILEDAPAVQTFVSSRLGFFVAQEVERQLLRGTATAEVQGLLGGRGVPVYARGTAAGNKAEQIFKAINGTPGSAFVEPDWVVMHPIDWQEVRLLKDTAGQYFGGGPFQGPYGSGQNLAASGQITGAIDSMWNKAVHVTAGIGAGTALVGTRDAAQVYSRGGLRVEATNSHASLFLTDEVAIRAERRLALCVYRPAAFC